jgi:hypothetical protein
VFGGPEAPQKVPKETPQDRNELLARIATLLEPAGAFRQDARVYTAFRLPRIPAADYSFSVWVYEDGEPLITASRADEHADESFWVRPFESAQYASKAAQYQEFLDLLQTALTSRTRITQIQGWLFTHFSCHAVVGGQWVALGGHSVARWIKGIPVINGRRHEYYSPPVLHGGSGAAER